MPVMSATIEGQAHVRGHRGQRACSLQMVARTQHCSKKPKTCFTVQQERRHPLLVEGMVAKDLAWRQASNLPGNIAIHSVNPSVNCHQHVLNAI